MTTFYKVLNGLRATHGRNFTYSIGEWTPWIGVSDIIPCVNGYHFCRNKVDLLEWLGPDIWECQAAGPIVHSDNKAVACSIRVIRRTPCWDSRSARLFAADCAERVLHLNSHPTVAQAVQVARDYANGVATRRDLRAAGAAVWDAAEDAASNAARGALRNTDWDAAWAAAWGAVRAVARNAAQATERAWQADRLGQYLRGEVE